MAVETAGARSGAEEAAPGGGAGRLPAWTTRQWLRAGVAAALAVLALLGTLGAWTLARMTTAIGQLADTGSPALVASVRLETALVDQETGIRGYGLSGRREFLRPYTRGLAEEEAAAARLRSLAGGDARARADLDAVLSRAGRWQEGFARPVAAAPAGAPVALASERAEAGRAAFDAVRRASADLQRHLRDEQARARADLDHALVVRDWTFSAIAAVVLLLAVLAFEGLRRGVTGPLERVSADARQVAEGRFDRPITPTGPADLRLLAADVEAMRRRLADELSSAEEAGRALDAQAAELRRSNTELEQFAYVASHDLQEPLRKVASFCQLLQRRYGGRLDERADQYIGFAVDGANRMQTLISELLAFSRVGRVHQERAAVDLGAVLAAALDDLGVALEESGAEVGRRRCPWSPGTRPSWACSGRTCCRTPSSSAARSGRRASASAWSGTAGCGASRSPTTASGSSPSTPRRSSSSSSACTPGTRIPAPASGSPCAGRSSSSTAAPSASTPPTPRAPASSSPCPRTARRTRGDRPPAVPGARRGAVPPPACRGTGAGVPSGYGRCTARAGTGLPRARVPTRTGHGGPGAVAVTGAAGPDGEESWPLDAALLGALRETGAAAAWLYLLSADRRVLVLAVLCGLPPEFIAPWTRIGTTAPLPVAEAVRDQRLVWVGGQEDLVRCYPRTALVLPYAFSLAAAPVTGARRWGAVLLVWPGERPAAESDRERSAVARTCARLAALLDERAAADAPLEPPAEPRVLPTAAGRGVRQPPETAAAFAERLPGGSCALDLEGRITFVTLGAARLLGRPAEDLLGELPWRALPWLDDPLYEDRYRSAVISRRPASFTVCRPPDRWLRFRLYPDAGGISVRVTSAGTGPRPAEPVPEPAPGGGHAGAGRLYRLMHLAAALTEATGVEDVVDLVADQIMPAFGAQSLAMATVEGDRLRIVGRRGYPAGTADHLGGLSLRDTSDPAVRSLRRGAPVFFASPEELERVHPAVSRVSDRQAWAFLPLVASGRPVGCCVLAYDRPRPFGADERAVLASLAGLLGQALERARLYDAKNRLACGLQRGLLPRALPSLPGLEVAARYLPATRGMDIGGDFYDLIRLDATTAAAVIGDVQGHNVAAAALMGQVRTAVHAYAMAGAPPDEVLVCTNRLLTDLDQDLFTSCLYARIDLVRHRACLASAGHPPPLLCGAGGPAGPIDIPPGLLLGIDPGADYPLAEVPMPPGSLLALYTDGLVEEPGTDLDRATADLALHLDTVCGRDLEALADDLLDHALPGGRRTDDTALLLLRAVGRE